jgi:hypothetical protein
LWPIAKRKEGEFTLLVAPYVLQLEEKKTFIHIIEELKTPISYLSTFKKQIHMGTSKLKGLKAHDYHVLMQQILPLCVHTLMPRGLRLDIIRMSQVFQRLCAKPIDPSMMNDLKQKATNTLCLLEKEFPPYFFNIMTHFMVHLMAKVDLCGHVHIQWMYPMERYMKSLKTYVWNIPRLKGSMVEGYTMEEAIGFCT